MSNGDDPNSVRFIDLQNLMRKSIHGLSLNIPQCQGTSRRIVEQSLNRGIGSQKEAFTSPQHLFVVVGRRCIQFGSGLVVNLERLHENFAKSSCMTVGPSRKTAFPSLTS